MAQFLGSSRMRQGRRMPLARPIPPKPGRSLCKNSDPQRSPWPRTPRRPPNPPARHHPSQWGTVQFDHSADCQQPIAKLLSDAPWRGSSLAVVVWARSGWPRCATVFPRPLRGAPPRANAHRNFDVRKRAGVRRRCATAASFLGLRRWGLTNFETVDQRPPQEHNR